MSRTIAMVKGTIWVPEWKEYEDRFTGVKVTQLTDYKGHSRHFYFTENGLYDGGKRLLFISDRDNSANLFSIHLKTGEMTQLTTYTGNDDLDACLSSDEQRVFLRVHSTVVMLDLNHFREKVLYRCPEGYQLGNLSCTSDNRFVMTCIQQDMSNDIRLDLGNGYVGHRELMEAAPHSQIIAIDIEQRSAQMVYEENNFITHINASPKLPWLLTFCHEGPWHLVDHRIWCMDLRNGNVWPIRKRLEPGEKVGHECFLEDGERIGYHGFRADGTNFWGSIKYDDTDRIEQDFEFDTWHAHMDGLQQAVVDGKGDVKNLMIWRRNEAGEYDGPHILCELRCSFHSQKVHAHPRFSTDGKFIFFTSDKSGYANIYRVELPEDITQLPLLQR